jgi:hypothetical protein
LFIFYEIKRMVYIWRQQNKTAKNAHTGAPHPLMDGGHEKVGENWCGHTTRAITFPVFLHMLYADTSLGRPVISVSLSCFVFITHLDNALGRRVFEPLVCFIIRQAGL